MHNSMKACQTTYRSIGIHRSPMPLLCCNYTPHTCKTFVQHVQIGAALYPDLICAGVGWTVSLVRLLCLLVQQKRGMLLVWGNLWAVYERDRVWC